MRGKKAYAAPEQLSSGELDRRTDIFALGVLLFELTTLVRPFGAANDAHTVAAVMQGNHLSLAQLRPDAGRLAAVIERAMANAPDDRFADAAALSAALRDAYGEPLSGPAAVQELIAGIDDGTPSPASRPSLSQVRQVDRAAQTLVETSASRRRQGAGGPE